MISIRTLWQRITASRTESALRAEIDRLRAENRALLNSILGIAGVPPLPVDRGAFVEPQLYPERGADSATSKTGVAVPMRRRSWHQINRMLEIESVRKKNPAVSS